MSNKTYKKFSLLPVAAAVLMTCSTVYAQDSAEVQAMISPNSKSISVGVGTVNNSRDGIRFGQYTGLNNNASALVDFELVKRDDATGTWTSFNGRNLGLDTREIKYSREKQGDWRYALDYNEIVRNDPYIINTGMTGIGTNKPTVNLIALPIPTGAGTWADANGYLANSTLAGHDEQLKVKRTAVGLSGEKWISPNLQLELSFRNEDKKGARMFGRVGITSGDMALNGKQGTGSLAGNGALLLTPEPIDSAIRTIEGKLNYSSGKLALSGGYYGSYYTNNFGSLTTTSPSTLNRGALWNSCVTPGCSTVQQLLQSDVALPPDNQAHQLYLSGNYAFSNTTRANFKVSFTHATQDESFVGMGLIPSATAPASLGGVVDTTLAQVGLSARPSKDLSINASLRYENRDDKTPVYVYNYGSAGSGVDQTHNWPSGSQTRTTAKLDGLYRLPANYSANLGLDWEHKVNPLPPAGTDVYGSGASLFRESLDETGIHAGLRKIMSDTLNGALSVEFKQRRGDDNAWMQTDNTSANLVVPFLASVINTGNKVLPDLYMDRDRTKIRGNLDWDASEKLSVQAVVEHGQDDYKRIWAGVALPGAATAQLIDTIPGARTISNDSLTLDASYKLSDDWSFGGFWTASENRWNVNKSGFLDDTKNKTDTFGLSLKGKVNPRLSVGMGLTIAQDVTTFNNRVTPTNAGIALQGNCAIPGTIGNANADAAGNICGFNGLLRNGNYLPAITYNTTKLNMFALYELDKKSAVKVNLVYQEFKSDDWQWGYNGVPFIYADNTTVSNPNQSLTYLGVSYMLKF